VAELEKKLTGEEVELAAKAKALEDMRKYIDMLTRSKESSAQQVAEMKSRLAAEEAELAEKLRIIEQLRIETETLQASNKAAAAVNVVLSKQVAELYAELNESSSSDDEEDREVVEVERTVIETEELVDGQIVIKREILEKTRTTHERELHHQSSKMNRIEAYEGEKEGSETDSQVGQVGEMSKSRSSAIHELDEEM
jgi:hypothetical protein